MSGLRKPEVTRGAGLGPIAGSASLSAADHAGCEGCQYRYLGTHPDWCYMFRENPGELPCAQHDDFADLRRVMSRTKLPIIMAIVAGLPNAAHDLQRAKGDSDAN